MTDQDYIRLKQQQKKRSNKLKKNREHWYMEENGIKEKKEWQSIELEH